jgi:flagellar biosynthesis protein
LRDSENSEVKPRVKAVAVHYQAGRDSGPRVLASGRGAVAEQILRIAFDRGVKVREDADLAEILAALDVDSLIPLEAFAAVAEILSYVYRAEGRGAAPGTPGVPNEKLRAAPATLAAKPPGPPGAGG